MRARTRDVMLPILVYPMTIPVIIGGIFFLSFLLFSARYVRAAGVARGNEATAIMWLDHSPSRFDVGVHHTWALWTI
jgi:hypothetical protein